MNPAATTPFQTHSLDGTGHIPILDGFRGVAIALVLLIHNFKIPGGWIGVDIFFVLSGFLITRILLHTRERADYFISFYARRTVRIFPAYYLLLAVAFALDSSTREHIWWYAMYLSDFTYARPSMDLWCLHHTWSLAVEEQFYLLWPMAIRLIPKRFLLWSCAGAEAIATVARLVALPFGLSLAFVCFNILTRCDGLIVGAVLAILVTRGLRPQAANIRIARLVLVGAFGVCSVLALTGRFSLETRANAWMQTLGMWSIVLGAAAAIWLGIAEKLPKPIQRLVSSRALAYTGRISYGLYLWHQPILVWAIGRFGAPAGPMGVLVFGGAVSISAYVLSVASWHLFEAPINRLKRAHSTAPGPA